MDFTQPEAADDLGGLVRTITESVCTPEHQRDLDGLATRFDRDLWSKLIDADILSTAAPESLGGGGFGVLEQAAVLEALGRQLAAVPYLESAVLAAGALATFGSPAQQQDWAAPAVNGTKVLTVALAGDMGEGPVQAAGSGPHTLTGTRTQVSYGPVADAFLVPAETAAGTTVFLVAADDPGLTVTPLTTTGHGSVAHLELSGVSLGADRIVGSAGQGTAVIAWLTTRQELGLSAFQLGVLARALEMTADYAREREQFDRPIGSFQAVSSRLADGYIDIKGLRLTLTQAAWRLSEDLPADNEVRSAAFWAAEAGHRVSHTAVHVHGGVGIDTDHPVHRYFLVAKQTEFALGSATGALLAIGRELADTPGLIGFVNQTMANPTVTGLLAPLAEADEQGVSTVGSDGDVSFVSWRRHIQDGAALAALLRSRMDSDHPPHVGVLLGNTPFFCTVLVAAALSGIVAVGLNPTRRGPALQRDIDHADCQLVLADSVNAQDGITALDVESEAFAAELQTHHGTPVEFPRPDPDDLFMLLFTSGTSGHPKAVRCTHEKVAFPGMMLAERFGLGPADTCYLSMPLFHSNAIMAGWAPAVAAGASIALRGKFSASQFFPDVRRLGATYANYVGKPLSYILATPERPDDADNPLRVAYGNEGAPRDLDRFAQRFGVRVVDGFGSSEGGVSIARTPDTPVGALGPLTDGVTILDVDTGAPCPPGVVGELVNTKGPGQFRGYYKDPDAESDRMRGGAYHSGDLAYRDEDGFAYFAGRHGDWMRVDGENLGTAPIERILMRYPNVTEVAVYPIPDPTVGDQVMAALVFPEGVAFDTDRFRDFLTEQSDLGPKQWPVFIRVGAALPRTETFKILKRQLSAEGTGCADPVYPLPRPSGTRI